MKHLKPFFIPTVLSAILLLSLASCGGVGAKSNPEQATEGENQETKLEDLTETDKIDYVIRDIVSEKYMDTVVDTLTINENAGTDDDGDFIALAYLTWNVKNKADTTKEMLAMYSEDLAARVGTDLPEVSELSVFWTVPYHDESNTAVKYTFERKGEGMYETDKMISSVLD